MHLRNGEYGYGVVTKFLHWLTVGAIVGQFAVGWTMAADDEAFDSEKDRIDALEDAGKDQAKEQGDAADDAFKDEIDRLEDELDAREDDYMSAAFSDVLTGDFLKDGLSLPEVHILLGFSIMALGLLRALWRVATPLPPWADYLTPGERRLEALLEKILLTLLFVVPGTGLLLIAGESDWLPVHIAAQVALRLTIAVHVGLVLSHTLVRRDGQLWRML
ncbi:MAG: cytochrome b [Mycobacterium sp.]